MAFRKLFSPKWLLAVPLALALMIGVACGGDDVAAPGLDAEDIKSAVQEAVKESSQSDIKSAVEEAVKSAVPEPVSAQEIQKLVSDAVMENIPEAPAGVSANEIRTMVEAAVSAAAPAGASPQEIARLVEAAVQAAAGDALTREDVASLVSGAVANAIADQPTPLTQEEIRRIVVAAIPTPVPAAEATATPLPRQVVGTPRYGGVVPAQALSDPTAWDPHQGVLIEDAHAVSSMYNQVVEYDPVKPTEIIGDLAQEWRITDGGLSYTFEMREDLKWNDGQDLTISDVVFSIERMVEEGANRPIIGAMRAYIESVETVGQNTVKINMNFPSSAFLRWFAVDPAKVVPKHLFDAGVDINIFENIVGSGPFLPLEYVPGVSYEVEKNPNYFKPGRPYFDGIRAFIIIDKGTEIAALKTGQILMAMSTAFMMDPEDAKLLQGDSDFTDKFDFFWAKGQGINHLLLNTTRAPFDDPNIRRAIFLALDRQEIVAGFGAGEYTIGTPMAPQNPFHLPIAEVLELPGFRQLDGEKHPDDIADARNLVAAVYPDGLDISILAPTATEWPDVALLLKERFGDIGINVTVINQEIGAAVGAMIGRDYDMAILAIANTLSDPDDAFRSIHTNTGRNFTSWTDPAVEDLFVQQQQETNPTARRELNYEMQRLVLNGSPGTVEMFWKAFATIVTKRLRTEVGPYIQSPSLFTRTKHEHEWLERE